MDALTPGPEDAEEHEHAADHLTSALHPSELTAAATGDRAAARILRLVPVTVDEVRAFAATLPRSTEAFVRGRVKFRVGRIVFLSFSTDGTVMGFGFPKDWRAALVESEPDKFSLPSAGDMRYSWVHVMLAKIDRVEMVDLVENAWALCAPKRLVDEYAAARTQKVEGAC
jgi:hypothetical protein